MEWTDQVDQADWIRARLDDGPTASMHGFMPRGLPAYVRILHPAVRDRPVGRAWPPAPADRHRRAWAAFQAAAPQIESRRVSWASAAEAFGSTLHAQAQWDGLLGADRLQHAESEPRDAAGWRYAAPEQGRLEDDLLAAVAGHLAAHTSTPDDGGIAVWDGWGGLTGFYGSTPARTFLTFDGQGGAASAPAGAGVREQHNAMIGRSIHDRFNGVFSPPAWQPGTLSDDISRGARLSLPAREHILFRGGIAELAEAGWSRRVPWAEAGADGFGTPSPSLIWPADQAWVLATEVDLDSTVVGGTPELIRALRADPRLEAIPLTEGTDLSWDADEVSR